MSPSSTPGLSRLKKNHQLSLAGVAALGVAALSLSLVPGPASADAEVKEVAAAPAAAWSGYRSAELQAGIAGQKSAFEVKAAAETKAKAETAAKVKAAAAKAKAAAKAEAATAVQVKAAAAAKARVTTQAAASRTAVRGPVYANNLDGWIREALDIMKKHNIPGTYEGIHRNVMRESSGNPNAINDWDINARNGVPSIGLLQVIKPTFDAYHIPGTKKSQWDPVANIVAACNYAADRYGSMDNVNSAY
ncbi:transglycosylase SLT domain-containing protein [Streptomyces sp. TRM76323]|uniref:Transglycosylase SLT domain-containing protein n=1 Tax=Streptomyces tamarix TaxID=3078565 RepID=A0ABU3QSI6_9ACTN|nr:transglycosylase SLT domain-containing protein [Streptomyces tamarix]MDT9685468.1 transglycosylase SLT domain-containing protein [Streptomyces tamarix]